MATPFKNFYDFAYLLHDAVHSFHRVCLWKNPLWPPYLHHFDLMKTCSHWTILIRPVPIDLPYRLPPKGIVLSNKLAFEMPRQRNYFIAFR
jgi:hypothetical protein